MRREGFFFDCGCHLPNRQEMGREVKLATTVRGVVFSALSGKIVADGIYRGIARTLLW